MSARRSTLVLVPQPAARFCEELRMPPRKQHKLKAASPVVMLTSLSAQALELTRTRGVADHGAPLARRLTRLAMLATGASTTASLCAINASALLFWTVFAFGTGISVVLLCLRDYVARRAGEITARARLLPEIERLDYLASAELARAERNRRRSRYESRVSLRASACTRLSPRGATSAVSAMASGATRVCTVDVDITLPDVHSARDAFSRREAW